MHHILSLADCFLRRTSNFVGQAFSLKLLIARRFAGGFLNGADRFLGRAFDGFFRSWVSPSGVPIDGLFGVKICAPERPCDKG